MAEHGEVGAHRREQFRNDRSDPGEVARTVSALERAGQLTRFDRGVEALGIHLCCSRCIDRVHPHLGAAPDIGLEGPRVPRQILRAVELQRVDEDRHDDHIGLLAGGGHELQMAVVQGSHGGDQGDRRTLGPMPMRPGAGRRGIGQDLGAGAHRVLTPSHS